MNNTIRAGVVAGLWAVMPAFVVVGLILRGPGAVVELLVWTVVLFVYYVPLFALIGSSVGLIAGVLSQAVCVWRVGLPDATDRQARAAGLARTMAILGDFGAAFLVITAAKP